jgi:hypothetical protein
MAWLNDGYKKNIGAEWTVSWTILSTQQLFVDCGWLKGRLNKKMKINSS